MFDLIVVKKNFTEFFEVKDICKSKLEIPLLKNLLLEISQSKAKGIEETRNNFFKARAIDLKSKNKTVVNMFKFCDLIKKELNENLIIYLIDSSNKDKREIYESWFLNLKC